jgi:hypothetical protein
MKTYQEQERFFLGCKAGLMEAFKDAGGGKPGADALVGEILKSTDLMERRVLFSFIRQALTIDVVGKEGQDALIVVADAGIAENLRQAQEETDAQAKDKRIDAANMISYNLAADLAFCWDDTFVREQHHFERGLKAGEDCIKWRRQLGKPGERMAMAHWVCGVHRLALGDVAGAEDDFERALMLDCEASGLTAVPEVSQTLPDRVLLTRGWVAIGKAFAGQDEEKAVLEKIIGIYQARFDSGDPKIKDEATWSLIQLKAGAKRMGVRE